MFSKRPDLIPAAMTVASAFAMVVAAIRTIITKDDGLPLWMGFVGAYIGARTVAAFWHREDMSDRSWTGS